MRFIKVPLLIIVFLAIVIFLVQNHDVFSQNMAVRFDLLYGLTWSSVALPVYFYLAVCFILGCLITLLFFLCDRVRNALALRKANKRVNALEKEINSLRTMALSPEQERAEAPAGHAPESPDA